MCKDPHDWTHLLEILEIQENSGFMGSFEGSFQGSMHQGYYLGFMGSFKGPLRDL